MANFLITTPNSLTQGTDTTDLFDLRTGAGVSIIAAGGADTISAAATGFTAANIQGGSGNDTVTFSVATGILDNAAILLGGGNDVLTLAAGTRAGTSSAGGGVDITGGGGNDLIVTLSGGEFGGNSSINGNGGNDSITVFSALFTNSLIAGGAGADFVSGQGINLSSSTVNGGGGNDSISLSGTISNSNVEGDSFSDTINFGNDTITIGGVFGSASLLQGGQGNDQVVISGGFTTGASVEGNAGDDSIFINAFVVSGGTSVGAGAGTDTITVSAALVSNFGTIQGGGGADSITVNGADANGGFIYGGEGADSINLGAIASGAQVTGGNAPAGASGVNIAYAAFSESTLGSFDVVSVSDVTGLVNTGQFGSFMVSQSVTNFSVVSFDGAGVSGNAAGQAVFSGVTNSLTARATLLDATLVNGNSVLFQAGTSTYLFVQGGAAGSGTSNDLLVELGGIADDAFLASGSITRVSNSALKVNFVG
ncbi:hypothetical protein KBY57_13075 [Cyanobium sp. Aljojuca 7D2]|uniref:beta strand repeat-containing protein n=1 Tax=Cyanobium sp. Aljojuca 7D2 TaxID=2823698 RepID=UPI0020CDE0BF|nr:bluetail domain-containing putative surface protein [Cyanobium sp. Aljojuca 7D2]MCP9891977.1 hypothetical protein [Cyanobium sp. Aljojuca 7D2]